MNKKIRSQRVIENQRKQSRERAWERRLFMKQKKLEVGCCSECGIACTENNWMGFDWDHLDPSAKIFALSRTSTRSWHDIEEEIKKCRLLCKICHSVITYKENHYRLGHKKYDEIDLPLNNQLQLEL
jgi:hypothetical protein